MNQQLVFSFWYSQDKYNDEDWNIWDSDLIEGERSHKQVKESSLQENMECNPFWKFDKSYALRDQNKYRNDSDSSINEVNRTDQISHIKQELHNDNCSHARLSLKDEVSILLKALVISKKNRKYSDASSPFSSDYQTKLRDKDGGVNEIDITMRQIEPYEVINIS